METSAAQRSQVPSLRTMAPRIVIAGVLPLVVYNLLRPHLSSDAAGLAIVSVIPAAEVGWHRWKDGSFDPIGIIAVVGLVFGLISALVTHGNALGLKLRESVLTGIFGVVCLGSLFARRPAMFFLARAFATGGDRDAAAAFDARLEVPGVVGRYRFVTAIWGVGLVAETGLRTVLALSVSTSQFLAVAPVIGWATIGGLLTFTTVYARRQEARFAAQVRREPIDGPVGRGLLTAFGEEIAALYPGWSLATGPTAEPDEVTPPHGCFLVAYIGETPVGCVALKKLDERSGEIKRLYVAPEARRNGVARRLLDAIEAEARELGCDVVRLDTGDKQPASLTLFRDSGYVEIDDYNGNPYASYWMEKKL